MPQQYQEGMTATGPNGETAVFRGGQWVVVPSQAPMSVVTKPADPTMPYKAPAAAIDLQAARTDAAIKAAQAPYAARTAAAEASKAEADAATAVRKAQNAGSDNSGSADERAKAIAAYRAADMLDRSISELESLNAIGPGATKGIRGLEDYNPYSTVNQRFDSAGNRARGAVINAYGFTSGQSNTPRETEMNIGGYIPQASDRDATIADKISSLKALRDNAREKAVSILGGVPDQNGNIHPASTNPVVAGGVPSGPSAPGGPAGGGNGPAAPDTSAMFYQNGNGSSGGSGGVVLSQDGTQAVPDPVGVAAAQHLNAMLKGGASDAQVLNYAGNVPGVSAQSVSDALAFRSKNPNYTGDYNFTGFDQKNVPMSPLRDLWNIASQSPVGAAGMNFANALSMNTLDNMTTNPALTRAGIDAASAAHPYASALGTLAGGAAAAGGIEAGAGAAATKLGLNGLMRYVPLAADGLYGAGAGAGAADEGSRGAGALLGSVAGVGGGMFGRALTRGAGNVLNGVRNASVRALSDRGIPTTIGQALSQSGRLGAAVKGIEDRLSGVPVIGDIVNERRREGLQQFNRAVFDEALAPIGKTAAGNVGETGIQNAQNAVGQAYRDALGGVRVTADAPFVNDMRSAMQAGMSIPRTGPEFGHVVNTRVGPAFNAGGGTIDGPQIQDMLQGLRKANFGNDAMGQSAKDALGNVEDALTGLVNRQAPDVMPAFGNANRAYRNLSVLQDAVGDSAKNTGGIFTPAQLAQKAAANTKRFGGKAANARGDRPFFDLSRAAQDILPSSVPDSGTAGRLALLAAPAALGGAGAGAGYETGDTGTGAQTGLALGTLLALGGTKAGQRMLTKLVLDRPNIARIAGDKIYNGARIGGIFGASLAQPPSQALLTGY